MSKRLISLFLAAMFVLSLFAAAPVASAVDDDKKTPDEWESIPVYYGDDDPDTDYFSVVDGSYRTYIKGSGQAITFTLSRPLEDGFSVYIDETLDSKNYTAEVGSNEITISADYLETLYNSYYYSVYIYSGDSYAYAEIYVGSLFSVTDDEGGVVITNVNDSFDDLVIPETIDGKTVVGISFLGWDFYYSRTISIPKTVRYISSYALDSYNLENITVDPENPYFTSKDGVLFDKSCEMIIAVPAAIKSVTVPATVSDISMLLNKSGIDITIDGKSPYFKCVDNVIYSADMKTAIRGLPDLSGNYEMPSSVVEIAPGAFNNCDNLESVTISNGVTKVTYSAFYSCYSLSEVKIPNSVKEIENRAFKGCALSELDIPSSVNTIGYEAFANNAFVSLTVPTGVKTIGERVFSYNYALESVTIPADITGYGSGMFMGCDNLSIANLAASVKTIPYMTFSGCAFTDLSQFANVETIGAEAFFNNAFEEITVPASVKSIGDYAFYANYSLRKLRFENPDTVIGRYAFGACGLTDAVLPDNLDMVDAYSFYSNPIDSINVPRGVRHNVYTSYEQVYGVRDDVYGGYGYDYVEHTVDEIVSDEMDLNMVTIPEGVTKITYHAFYYCNSLYYISLPKSVKSISGTAFANTAWYKAQPDGPIYIDEIFYGYKGSAPEDGTVIVKNGTKVIADYAFSLTRNNYYYSYDSTGNTFTNIVLPEGLEVIGDLAFAYCEDLEKITIPASVTDIGMYTFAGCSSLSEIEVAAGNTAYTVVDGILYSKDMTELIFCPYSEQTRTIVVPESVKRVDDLAFCVANVSKITVKNPACKVGDYAACYARYIKWVGYKSYYLGWCGKRDEITIVKMGDVNGDGSTNARDVILVMRAALPGFRAPDDYVAEASDIDGDGFINARDVIAVMKAALALLF